LIAVLVLLGAAAAIKAIPALAAEGASRGGYDLIVLGASRRPGELLFFGNTAAAVFDRSPISVLLIAS
jgi:nucleotide-binding universal stress UspA family protein